MIMAIRMVIEIADADWNDHASAKPVGGRLRKRVSKTVKVG
ncbi:MAG: hypothetical protein AABX40_08210 [Candidatus Hydrothermarchaeota archaeon]